MKLDFLKIIEVILSLKSIFEVHSLNLGRFGWALNLSNCENSKVRNISFCFALEENETQFTPCFILGLGSLGTNENDQNRFTRIFNMSDL